MSRSALVSTWHSRSSQALAAALKENRQVRRVELQNNGFGDAGAEAWAFCLLDFGIEEKHLLSAGFSRDVAPEPYDQEDCSQFESHHYCGGEGAL